MDKKFSFGFYIEQGDLEIPPVLLEFLDIEEMGMDGLEFMLKDPNLCSRIPKDVRYEYEILYAQLDSILEQGIEEVQLTLDEIRSNPRHAINSFIQALYEQECLNEE